MRSAARRLDKLLADLVSPLSSFDIAVYATHQEGLRLISSLTSSRRIASWPVSIADVVTEDFTDAAQVPVSIGPEELARLMPGSRRLTALAYHVPDPSRPLARLQGLLVVAASSPPLEKRIASAQEQLYSLAHQYIGEEKGAWAANNYSALHKWYVKVRTRVVASAPIAFRETRDSVLQTCAKVLCRWLPLSRCGIFIPTADCPDLWTLGGHWQIPEALRQHLIYPRGQGLTGATLSLPFNNARSDVVVSNNIFADPRFVPKGGGLSTSTAATGSYSFLGVPLYLSAYGSPHMPYGALVCLRRSDTQHTPHSFGDSELALLQSVAIHLSYCLDILLARQSESARRTRLIRLTEVWKSSRSLKDKYTSSLELLRELGSFKRLLLASIDAERRKIIGEAQIGFEERLVSDTVRTLHPDGSSPLVVRHPNGTYSEELSEDILSAFVRMTHGRDVVWIEEVLPDHPLLRHLHVPTATRVGLGHHFVLVSLCTSAGEQAGVLLADYSESTPSLTRDMKADIATLCQHLADLMQLNSANAHLTRAVSVIGATLQELTQHEAPIRRTQQILRSVLQNLCESYKYQQAIVLCYDRTRHSLRGLCGYAINEASFISQCELDAGETGRLNKPSFSGRVFQHRKEAFLWNATDPPVNNEYRIAAGIAPHLSVFGVPLLYGDGCVGVMVLFTNAYEELAKLAKKPSNEPRLPVDVVHVAGIAAALVASSALSADLRVFQEQALAESAIIATVDRVAAELSRDETVSSVNLHAHPNIVAHLNAIARECAGVLGADLCALVLPDDTVAYQCDAGAARPLVPLRATFTLCAGHNYKEKAISDKAIRYQYGERSLTMAVVESYRSHVCDDITKSVLWSKKACTSGAIEDAVFDNVGTSIPRAWLGVPITFSDGETSYFFGVMSFTRLKMRSGVYTFTVRDVVMAERLTNILALALSCRVWREKSATRLVRWYGHDFRSITQMITVELDSLREQGRPIDTKRDEQKIRQIGMMVELQDSIFTACAAFNLKQSGDALEERTRYNIVADDLEFLRFIGDCFSAFSGVDIECEFKISDTDTRAMSLREQLAMVYCAYAMTANAVKAVRRHIPQAATAAKAGNFGRVSVLVAGEDAHVRLHFEDNGCGFPERFFRMPFREAIRPGYSTFESTGLGLVIAEFLVRQVGGAIRVVERSDCEGAHVIVSIPCGEYNSVAEQLKGAL